VAGKTVLSGMNHSFVGEAACGVRGRSVAGEAVMWREELFCGVRDPLCGGRSSLVA
jgi:hypothetical protein